jgi:hypothetical protein
MISMSRREAERSKKEKKTGKGSRKTALRVRQ